MNPGLSPRTCPVSYTGFYVVFHIDDISHIRIVQQMPNCFTRIHSAKEQGKVSAFRRLSHHVKSMRCPSPFSAVLFISHSFHRQLSDDFYSPAMVHSLSPSFPFPSRPSSATYLVFSPDSNSLRCPIVVLRHTQLLDASIWLNQFAKAIADDPKNRGANVPLKALLGRLFKLFYYGIKFVFSLIFMLFPNALRLPLFLFLVI